MFAWHPFFTTLVGNSTVGQEITFTQNHVIGGLIGGLVTRVFFLQFCDVTKLAITHKKIKPNLSID
jgi:hypothetical protein